MRAGFVAVAEAATAIAALSACGGELTHPGSPDAGGGQAAFVASWPTFEGSCPGVWTATRAVNVTGTDEMGFQVDDLQGDQR
ncbi:MAG TPA: hypothetical protein VGK67_33730 [Myxococcales bacterium]|jgi:hypothetical protein